MTPNIQKDVPLKDISTLHVGGVAEYFTTVDSLDELMTAVQWAKEGNHSMTVLGGGSNVVVSDSGMSGLVIKNEIVGISHEESENHVLVTAGAGVVFDDLVHYTVEHGWWGLENLSAIPGSVGATPIQNVGAYGVEVCDHIKTVGTFDVNSESEHTLDNDECNFSYRNSMFKTREGKRYIVTSVTFQLSKDPVPVLTYRDLSVWFTDNSHPTITEIREAVIAIRKKKFPDWKVVGTVGSFFKNPIISEAQFQRLKGQYPELPGFPTEGGVKVHLGWILDKVLHLRGYKEGSVGTYEHQALVLINYGDATSHDVEQFAHMIEQKVFDTTHIRIEWEATRLENKYKE